MWWKSRLDQMEVICKKLVHSNTFLISFPLLVGYLCLTISNRNEAERNEQGLLRLQLDSSLRTEDMKKSSDSTKKAISKMLAELPYKTTRQKLEDVS
jgi:hypothetical protein